VVSAGAIFTIGYEGASLVSFIGTLVSAGVAALLDVRRDPWSRRPEFRKHALEETLAAAGIAYRHEPRLGVPREIRQCFRGGKAPKEFAAWYAAEVLSRESGLVREISESVVSTSTALLCYEADPAHCHRSLLARELGRSTGLTVRHLTP
jgi:uncharacterized protein (DUF488 family)